MRDARQAMSTSGADAEHAASAEGAPDAERPEGGGDDAMSTIGVSALGPDALPS